MDSRLLEAARAGDTTALEEILNDYPLILHQVTLTPSDSPLHVACLLGHVDLARLLMERNKDLALERNQQGFTPLHLASSKGYLEIVKNLLRINKELCREEDQSGRIALHCAAMKGKIDVARELIEAYPETASVRTQRGETILHLVVMNNQFRALGPLVGFLIDQNLDTREFFNSQDEFGQTILHLAVDLQNFQMVKLIVNDTSGNVNLNATNSANLTALDMAVLRRTADRSVDSKDIEDVLRAAVAGGGNYNRAQDHRVQITGGNNSNQTLTRSASSSHLDPNKYEVRLSAVMMIAALLATLSFQAALNPPGGVWQDWGNTNTTIHLSGTSLHSLSLSARTSLYIYNLLLTHVIHDVSGLSPVNTNVRDENRNMPGKSISRELYADSFFAFIHACGSCFFFSIFTLLYMPMVLYMHGSSRFRFYFLYTMLFCGLMSAMDAFFSGVALVTDTHVSIWLFISGILLTMMVVVLAILLITSERKWNFLTLCASRLRTKTWLRPKSVGFIVMPVTTIFLSYALDAIRHHHGSELGSSGAP